MTSFLNGIAALESQTSASDRNIVLASWQCIVAEFSSVKHLF